MQTVRDALYAKRGRQIVIYMFKVNILVAALVATGIGNMLAIVGLTGLVRLPVSLYGQLLIAKLLLFKVLKFIATVGR